MGMDDQNLHAHKLTGFVATTQPSQGRGP
jgi:hypothetical protein